MSAMPGRNPYRPGVGLAPAFLAGRDRELRRFRSILRGAPHIPANIRVTGLRGMGKTVLLGEYERLAGAEGWAADMLELDHRHDDPDELIAALTVVLERARRRLSRAVRIRRQLGKAVDQVSRVSVGFEEVKVSFDPAATDHDVELAEDLYATAVAATGQSRAGYALLLDETQVLENPAALSMLIAAVATLQRNEVPIALVIAGLPNLAAQLLKARTYTERMFRGEELGPLDLEAAQAALVRPLDDTGVTIDVDLVDHVLARVEGYPYFVQLWGAELWDTADFADVQHLSAALLPEVEPEIVRRLDLDFYEPRLRILTPAEQDLLMTTATCPYPPLQAADIIARTDKSTGNTNVLLGRIVKAGVMYRLRRGEYEYTAPRFHEFLQRRS
jgi:hypothetical protein